MTLEELSVIFTADTTPFASAAMQMEQMISALSAQADGLASRFYEAGAQAAEGLRQGLLSRQGAVEEAARSIAQAAANALRGALQIHSPSRVAFDAGCYFDEGLLQGIASGTARVEKQAAALGSQTAHALTVPETAFAWEGPSPREAAVPVASAQNQPLQLSLTVPLEIDGYRLGVAAIEGINLVNQGAGRVEWTL